MMLLLLLSVGVTSAVKTTADKTVVERGEVGCGPVGWPVLVGSLLVCDYEEDVGPFGGMQVGG
jgi:hypothetical protein